MRRGTTPRIIWKLPFSMEIVVEMWLTLSQRSREVLTKTKAEMIEENGSVYVTLSQEDTLSLDDHCDVEIQVRGRTTAGEAFASQIRRVTVEEILKDGVI